MNAEAPPQLDSLVILGTGAMACLFGARLARQVPVTLLGTWREGLEALRERGIRLQDGERETTVSVRASSDPADAAGATHALVLVKSWQTARAARMLKDCLSPGGVALSLQNGLGNLETLQEHLGEERAALGVTTIGATLVGPGHVRAGGSGPIHLMPHPRLGPLSGALCTAGFEVVEAEDLEGLLWSKLVVNACINPLTALLRAPNGDLLRRPSARRLMGAVAEETASVAAARGVRLPFEDPAAAAEGVAERTSENHSSMLQDVLRGAPTEIEAINGAVVREGERLGVPTPINRTLWRLVRALEPQPAEAPA